MIVTAVCHSRRRLRPLDRWSSGLVTRTIRRAFKVIRPGYDHDVPRHHPELRWQHRVMANQIITITLCVGFTVLAAVNMPLAMFSVGALKVSAEAIAKLG